MTASNQSLPQPPAAPDPGELVPVFLTVAVRTSGGNGPGAVQVPPAEAGALVRAKYAVGGDQPPRGWPG